MPTPLPLRPLSLIAFAVVAYLPSLSVPFVFDDIPNIVLNPWVHPEHFSELPAVLDTPINSRRVLAHLSFALNYLYGQLDPWGYHAVNIMIHALNAVLLYALMRALSQAPRSPGRLRINAEPFAFSAALLWAVHPVNTQAVTYIVQRMASLAAVFYLLALLLFVLWRCGRIDGRWAWPALILAGSAGFVTKEHVVTLPAALLLLDIILFSGWRRYHAWLAAGLLALAAVLGALYAGSAFTHLLETSANRGYSGLERLLTEGRVIAHYLSLLAWPDPARLQIDYAFTISHGLLQPPSTVFAWGCLLLVSGLALRYWHRWPWPALGWLFFLLALAVESSIIMLEIAFEHRLYLPSTLLIAGLLAPMFAGLARERERRGLALVLLVLAGGLTYLTMARNADWTDKGQLWAQDIDRGASPYRARLNSAVGLTSQGHFQAALDQLEPLRDQELKPVARAKVQVLRGEALAALDRHAEALEALRAALASQPYWQRPAYSAANSLLQLGRRDAAEALAAQMREHRPSSVFTAILDAELARHAGRLQTAEARLRSFIAPKHGVTANNLARLALANVQRARQRFDAAAQTYREIIAGDPMNWAAWSQLYQLLRAGGEQARAAAIGAYLERMGVDPEAWAVTDP